MRNMKFENKQGLIIFKHFVIWIACPLYASSLQILYLMSSKSYSIPSLGTTIAMKLTQKRTRNE